MSRGRVLQRAASVVVMAVLLTGGAAGLVAGASRASMCPLPSDQCPAQAFTPCCCPEGGSGPATPPASSMIVATADSPTVSPLAIVSLATGAAAAHRLLTMPPPIAAPHADRPIFLSTLLI